MSLVQIRSAEEAAKNFFCWSDTYKMYEVRLKAMERFIGDAFDQADLLTLVPKE